MAVKKAIFLDKDGTLIPDLPYNVDPALVSLSADSITGLKALQEAGYSLIVISNQSGIGKGLFTTQALVGVEWKLQQLLQEQGLWLSGFYYCPHHQDAVLQEYRVACNCHKPNPGLILEAAMDHQIELSASWMIGDILHDVEAGHRAGCRSVLVNNGNETEWDMGDIRIPEVMVGTIDQAAASILNISLSELYYEKGLSSTDSEI